MKYRLIKRLNQTVSEVGFGGWQLGNKQDWQDMDFENGVFLVKEAFSRGMNFFDTAPNYSGGMSERIIGEALKDVRTQVFINTKYGHSPERGYDFSEEHVEESVDHSLERLQTTYLDSIILHNPPRYILEGKTNHQEVFTDLKNKGKIRAWGVSIDSLEELEIVLENLDVDTIEIMFNISFQGPKQLFDEVKKRGILLIVKIPLDSGWLSGKYDENSTFTGIRSRWTKAEIKTRAEIIKRIKKIVKDDDLVPYALAFVLSFDAVTTIIPGTKNIKHLESNIAASEFSLQPDHLIGLEVLYDTYIKNLNLPW